MRLTELMTSPLWLLAGWTMLHFLWAGTLVGLVALGCRRRVRRASPSVRYSIALASLMLLAVTPIAMALAIRSDLSSAGISLSSMRREVVPDQLVERSRRLQPTHERPKRSGQAENDELSPSVPAPADLTISNSRWAESQSARGWFHWPVPIVSYLPWLWLAGGLMTFGVFATGLVGAGRLHRRSRFLQHGEWHERCRRLMKSMNITLRVRLAICERITGPILIGVFRPVILLPAAAVSRWSPQQMELVLLHELDHVRRWDNRVNLLQRIVESLLFFQPAVWIVSNWVRQEREHCCDEFVVTQTNRPDEYARLLVSMAAPELAHSRESLTSLIATSNGPAAAMMAQNHLVPRIRSILKSEEQPMPISRTTLSVMFLTLLCTLMLLGLSAGQAEPTDKKLEAVVAEEASLSSKRLAQADGAESEAEQQTDDPAKFNREDLRYDNMTFQEWQSRLKTELKSERRVEAVIAMGAFGAKGYAQEAAVAILELMKEYDLSSPVGDLLKDNDLNKVTLAAERALRRIGQPAVPMLVTALKGENRNTRLFVAHTIPRFWGSVPDFIPGLISAAQDPDNYVRREVFAGLDNFAEDNPERLATAADVLVGALNDDDKIVRREAARALQRIAPYAELDALQFIPAMKETALGYSPAAIVGAIDPDPTAVVPLLIDILKDENAEVRLQAIYALGDLGPKARDAVPALIAELRFDDVRTRRSVIHSLGRIGPAANAAVPDLLKALERGDKDVIGYANEALQKINRSIREPAVVR